MKKRITLLFVALFIAGAVIEGIRNGATLMLLQHSLFAVGIVLEMLPETDSSKRWPATRVLSVTTWVAAMSLFVYHIFIV